MTPNDFIDIVVSSLAEVIIIVDKEGNITYVSPQASKILGVKAEQLIGEKIWNIPSLKDPGKMEELFIKTKLSGPSKRKEIAEIRRGNETVYLQIYATPLSDFSGFALTLCDVTSIIEAYQKIEDLNEVLKLMNKILRHDLMNKLAIIRGYLELYLETEGKDKIEKSIKVVDEAAEIIERMREIESSLIRSEMKRVELRKVVEKVAEKVQKFGVQVNVEGDAVVFADDAIYSVFENIMNNSIKHGNATRIQVTIEMEGDFCKVKIADNGIGLPMQFADKLFTEGFSYGKKAGTGLGLYIVKKVIERYGGKFRAYNDKGAVIELYLNPASSS